jgi:hypothetical protein
MLLWIRRDLSTASTVYVLPDALEKHCIQAEPNVDKNGSASKKAAFAHLLLWICRRFSTNDVVLQRIWWLNLPAERVVQRPRSLHPLAFASSRHLPSRSFLSAVQDRHSLRYGGIPFFL